MLAEIIWDQQTLAVVMVFMVPIIAILAGVWAKVEKNRAETELKRSMIERGMSADDIERVISIRPQKKN